MKRLTDVIISVAGLVLLAPALIFLATLIKINLGSPVFFKQVRAGKGAKPFMIFKFRTMLNTTESNGHLLPDQERITPFGSFLRRSSLDEFPELWNVLKGDMSLVGPRPLLMEYLPLYSPEERRRHNMRPGITGWAQVNGRNGISWEDKFKYDIWYIENHSFWLDAKIVLITIKKVLMREGVSAAGDATMPKFTGNKQV